MFRSVTPSNELPSGSKDVQNIIDRFQHKAVAGAKRLVRWLNGKLVAVVGKALVEEVETIKAGNDLRV